MRTLRPGSEKNPYEKTHFREIAKIVVWKALALSLALALLTIDLVIVLVMHIKHIKHLVH